MPTERGISTPPLPPCPNTTHVRPYLLTALGPGLYSPRGFLGSWAFLFSRACAREPHFYSLGWTPDTLFLPTLPLMQHTPAVALHMAAHMVRSAIAPLPLATLQT